jgi:hypothetical protein
MAPNNPFNHSIEEKRYACDVVGRLVTHLKRSQKNDLFNDAALINGLKDVYDDKCHDFRESSGTVSITTLGKAKRVSPPRFAPPKTGLREIQEIVAKCKSAPIHQREKCLRRESNKRGVVVEDVQFSESWKLAHPEEFGKFEEARREQVRKSARPRKGGPRLAYMRSLPNDQLCALAAEVRAAQEAAGRRWSAYCANLPDGSKICRHDVETEIEKRGLDC